MKTSSYGDEGKLNVSGVYSTYNLYGAKSLPIPVLRSPRMHVKSYMMLYMKCQSH